MVSTTTVVAAPDAMTLTTVVRRSTFEGELGGEVFDDEGVEVEFTDGPNGVWVEDMTVVFPNGVEAGLSEHELPLQVLPGIEAGCVQFVLVRSPVMLGGAP